jgi:hypothetical protein
MLGKFFGGIQKFAIGIQRFGTSDFQNHSHLRAIRQAMRKNPVNRGVMFYVHI